MKRFLLLFLLACFLLVYPSKAKAQLSSCTSPYDLLILIDMSASFGGSVDTAIRTAVGNLIDNYDYSQNRLSIAGQPGWKFFSNSGYISNTTLLKAKLNYVTLTQSNQCFPAMSGCGQLFDNDLRAFLSANQRQVNGVDIPQIVWIISDGDVYQIPTGVNNSNYAAYNVNTYATLSPYIDQWRDFIDDYPVSWARYPSGYTLLHPIWTSDNVMVKDSNHFYPVQGGIPAQNIYNSIIMSIERACVEIPVTPTPTPTPVPNGIISGNIYLNDSAAGLSGGLCSSPFPPVPYEPVGIESVTVSYNSQEYIAPINADGSFSISVPQADTDQYSVTFESGDPLSSCGCPNGCTYSGVDSPASGITFYYQPQSIRNPWWQIIGGSAYAGQTTGLSISSRIPIDTCVGSCKPYLTLRNSDDDIQTSGDVFSGGGDVDTSDEVGLQQANIDEDQQNIFARSVQSDELAENYDFFYRLYSMGLDPQVDFVTSSVKPLAPPTNGRAYFANTDITIEDPWTVQSGESIVVFVDGNLTISSTVDVEEGGFLSFIVKGNTVVSPTVCQDDYDSTTGVVEGMFISDGVFRVESNGTGDCKFVGEGSFVGWSGVELNRDFTDGALNDTVNSNHPVEVFVYRPDMVANTPDRMRRPFYLWQEVAP